VTLNSTPSPRPVPRIEHLHDGARGGVVRFQISIGRLFRSHDRAREAHDEAGQHLAAATDGHGELKQFLRTRRQRQRIAAAPDGGEMDFGRPDTAHTQQRQFGIGKYIADQAPPFLCRAEGQMNLPDRGVHEPEGGVVPDTLEQ